MRRVLLHIAFWVAYLVQDILLIFLVNTTRMNPTMQNNLFFSIEHALLLLLPKLIFTYFILYIALEKIIDEGFGRKWSLYSAAALVFSILLYRAILVTVVDPYIYGFEDESAHFFYLLGFPVALMDIGFVSGAAIAIKQVRQQLTRTKIQQLLIQEKLETELKYLRNQINPHFLFNTLNNIYGLARKRSDETPDAIMKLSKLLRFMLYDSAKPFITIGEEARLLEDYIDLEKMRYGSKLTLRFLKNIKDEKEKISPLLLLPFVENAFKHGASDSRYASFIDLELSLKNGILKFMVKNTKENNVSHCENTNIGLQNVRRQLELLYKEYDMEVINEKSVFIVLLKINLESYAKNNLPYS